MLFIYIIKTLATHQVTNDHSLSCLHKFNTSNVQTRLANVRTTQKWLHNSTCTTLPQRLQSHPVGWTKTRLTISYWMNQEITNYVSYSDESSSPHYLSDGRVSIQRHHTRSWLVYYITRKH